MSIALSRSGTVAGAALARATASDSDHMLVERIAVGDKLAMQVLFARHRTAIYRWLYRLVGNEIVAEDLLSDVFFDVWRQAGRFEGRSAVTTWLLSIARFKALSARRRRTDAELDEGIESTLVDPSNDPETALQEKNRGEVLRQALTKLSTEHREVGEQEVGRIGGAGVSVCGRREALADRFEVIECTMQGRRGVA